MKYYIDPFLFYIINVIDSLENISFIIWIFMLAALILILMWNAGSWMYGEYDPKIKLKKFLIYFIIITIIRVFIPNETTMKEMLTASYITKDNASDAKDIVDYMFERVEGVSEEEEDTE